MIFISSPVWPDILTARQAASDIGKMGGWKVQVGKSLQSDHVFIVPREATPRQLLDLLAKALNASVLRTSSGLEIDRTPEDLKRIQAELANLRAKSLQNRIEAIEKFRQTRQKGDPVTDFWTEIAAEASPTPDAPPQNLFPPAHFASELLPSQKVLMLLIRRIGVNTLANLASGKTVIYEDSPNQSAEPLPEDRDIIEAYNEEVTQYFQYQPTPTDLRNLQRTFITRYLPDKTPGTALSKLRLVEKCDPSAVAISLEGYDDAGNLKLRADVSTDLGFKRTFSDNLKVASSRLNPSAVTLPPQSLADAKFPRSGGFQEPVPTWFSLPDEKEPLDSFVRDAALCKSELKLEKPFVASLTDSMWRYVKESIRDSALNSDALDDTLSQWEPYELLDASEGTVWRPKDPEFGESGVGDRKTLRDFVQGSLKSGVAGIRSVATFFHRASERPSPLAIDFEHLFQQWQGDTDVIPRSYPEILWALGAIPDDGWDALCNGQVLTCGQLGWNSALEDLLKADDEVIHTSQPITGLLGHPLEALANGVSDETKVAFKVRSVDVLKEVGQESAVASTPYMPAAQFGRDHPFTGRIMLDASGNFIDAASNDRPLYTQSMYEKNFMGRKYRPGTQLFLQVVVGLDHSLHLEIDIPGPVESEKKWFAFADLPQEFRDMAFRGAEERTRSLLHDSERLLPKLKPISE